MIYLRLNWKATIPGGPTLMLVIVLLAFFRLLTSLLLALSSAFFQLASLHTSRLPSVI